MPVRHSYQTSRRGPTKFLGRFVDLRRFFVAAAICFPPGPGVLWALAASPLPDQRAKNKTEWNKADGGPLSLHEDDRSGGVDVTEAFSDQLVASLPRLRRFARGLAGNASQADDLVQAACERALSRQHQFQEGTRFDSWMFRIVQTIWIDQIRSRDVRKEDGEIEDERFGSDEPVRRAEARLALEEVRRAAARLPAEQREALMLVTVDGFSYKEAAEIAQVPVGTIMSRLARARVALVAQLDAGGGLRRSSDDAAAQR